MDGFEHYGSTDNALDGAWASFSGFAGITNSGARTGGWALSVQDTGAARRVFNSAGTTKAVGGAYFFPNLPAGNTSTVIAGYADNANGQQVGIMLDSSGTITAVQQDTGHILGTTDTPCVPARAYTHIESEVFCDPAVGTVEVRVNGVTVLMLTGQNTDPQGSGNIAQVNFQTFFGDSGFILDDLYAWNTDGGQIVDFVGDKKVYTEFPAVDTPQADWIPSTGVSGYAMLATNPPNDDVDYVQAVDAGELSIYGVAPLPDTVVSIAAVMTAVRTWKTDAGSSHVQVGLLSGSANADGADNSITSAPTYWMDVFEVDPATGAPWTVAGFNAVELTLDRTL